MSHLKRYLVNALTVFANPKMFPLFARWKLAAFVAKCSPVITLESGINIGHFCSFSEMWLWHRGISHSDHRALSSVINSDRTNHPIAIDVGANLGIFSLELASIGFQRVYSFEPIRETFERFGRNLMLNPQLQDRIVPIKSGVASNDGVLKFLLNVDSAGQNKLVPERPFNESEFEQIEECPVTTLASVFKKHELDHVRLLKVDVEGFEPHVLKGGNDLLGNGRVEFLYIEVIPEALRDAGSSQDELRLLVSELGFVPVIPLATSGKFETVTFDKALLCAGQERNILLRHRSHVR